MALTSRDWWMLGLGLASGFFVFSTLGKKVVLTGMGLGTAEIERVIAQAKKKAEERAKPYG